MNLTLLRSSGDGERITGILQVNGQIFATMERPWIPNPAGVGGMPRQSCVPPGVYKLIAHHSVNFPNTYALINHELGVYYQPGEIPNGQKWGRSAILIHVGNRVRDIVGCIALGKEHGEIQGEPAVLRSTLAMREFDKILNRCRHTLEIQ
jgi:hypothetical protein